MLSVVRWLQNVFESKKKDSAERRIEKEIDKQLSFSVSKPLTLGVEFELALLNVTSLMPSHEGPSLVEQLHTPQIKKELFEHMIEVTSTIGNSVYEAEEQIKGEIIRLLELCSARELALTGTGCPPTIKLADIVRMKDDRLDRLHDERRILIERYNTLGMHVHLGMESAESCIRYNSFFMHFIPHFIALAASSPFDNGVDTGLASVRPTVTESLPIAGSPYHFQNWQEYVHLCRAMYKAGSIQNVKDLWWDLRPCPRFGTLEIRACDQPATLSEGMAIVAFIHVLAHWFQKHQGWLDEMPRPDTWRMRENKWRAMRYGLDAQIVVNNMGETRPICEDVKLWLERLQPHIEELKYEKYIDTLKSIMENGNSAKRQQAIWEATGSIEAVAKFNCDEFSNHAPLWSRVEKTKSAAATEKLMANLPLSLAQSG